MNVEELETRRATVTAAHLFLLQSMRGTDFPPHAPRVWQHMVGDFDFLLSGEEVLYSNRISSGRVGMAAGEYFLLTQNRPLSPRAYYEWLRGLRGTMQDVINGSRSEEADLASLDDFLQGYHEILTRRIDEARCRSCHL